MTTDFNRGIEMTKKWNLHYAMVLATLATLPACGGGGTPAPAGQEAASDAAAATSEPTDAMAGDPAPQPAVAGKLLAPPGWMPEDWDMDAYGGSIHLADRNRPDYVLDRRRDVQLNVPFTLWALAHDTVIDESFEPVWVWWTALRSCERGIGMMEDLAGEFGNRERGRTALTNARNEFKQFAATQPAQMTLYLTATLGQWDGTSSSFPLDKFGRASTIDAREVRRERGYTDAGAELETYVGPHSAGKQHLTRIRTPYGADFACVSGDGKTGYDFRRQANWTVEFGEFQQAPLLPAVNMAREQAAEFSRRNPEREVMLSLAFGASTPSPGQERVTGVLRKVVVTDMVDGSVLAEQAY